MRFATLLLLGLFVSALAKAPAAQVRYDDLPDGAEFVAGGRKWDKTALTYYFQNGTADIAGTAEHQAVRTAMSYWAGVTPLTFTEVYSSSTADIVVLWTNGNHGDGSPFDGVEGVLAHAFYPPPNVGALSGDVHFDDAEAWTTQERPAPYSQPVDLVTVAAHEIGHSLGLGHSLVQGALMYAYYNGSHRYLSQDDVSGIQSLYGSRQAPSAPTNLRVTNLGASSGSPQLQWTAPTGNVPVTGYNVYRELDTAPELNAVFTTTATSYTDYDMYSSSSLQTGVGARYHVTALNQGAESPGSNEVVALVENPYGARSGGGATSEEGYSEFSTPTAFAVSGVRPNPLRAAGELLVELPEPSLVRIRIFDVTGRLVLTVANEERPAGYHTIGMDAGGLPSGVYIYRVETGEAASVGTFTVVR